MGKNIIDDDLLDNINDDELNDENDQIIDLINQTDWILETNFLIKKINELIQIYKKYDTRIKKLTPSLILNRKKFSNTYNNNPNELRNLALDIDSELLYMYYKHKDILDNIEKYKLINDDLFHFQKLFFNNTLNFHNIFNKLCYYCI
jgi:hypothetical protein